MYLMSSRLFSRCAGTSFSIGLRELARSHERRRVGPLVLYTMGRILITGQVLCLDKVVEPAEIGVCGDEALPDKKGYLVLSADNYFSISNTDTGSLDDTTRFYSYLYLFIYLRYFIPTFLSFSHVFTSVYKPHAEYFFFLNPDDAVDQRKLGF